MTKAPATAKTAAQAGTKRRLRLWFVFIAVFMAWALYTIIHQLQSQGATGLRLAAVQHKIAAGEKMNADLRQKIERFQDPEYIQEIARKDQGMVMPGEQPIQVTGQGN